MFDWLFFLFLLGVLTAAPGEAPLPETALARPPPSEAPTEAVPETPTETQTVAAPEAEAAPEIAEEGAAGAPVRPMPRPGGTLPERGSDAAPGD